MSLFFDKETHLLVMIELRITDEITEKEVTETTSYKDFKEVDGIQQAMKLTVRRNNKPYFDGTVTDIKLVDRLEDKLFAKP